MTVADIGVRTCALDLLNNGETMSFRDVTFVYVVVGLVEAILEASFAKFKELRAIPDGSPPEVSGFTRSSRAAVPSKSTSGR